MTANVLDFGLSKNHRLVYEVVQDQGVGRHLAMADVFSLARLRQPAIGFTTVYRALTRLRDLRLVSEIGLPGADCAYYEPAGPAHAHFRCTGCGTVSDVEFALSRDALGALALQLRAEIARSAVTLEGRCSACIASSNDAKR